MEDTYVSNSACTNTSQINYSLLSTKKKPWMLETLSRNKSIIVLVALLIILIPVYMVTRDKYKESFLHGTVTTQDVPRYWIERAVYYSTQNHTYSDKRSAPSTNFKLVCYYTFPSETNSSDNLLPANIDPNLCTHINVGFASILNNSIVLSDFQAAIAKRVVALKERNRNLKVLLSVGGGGTNGGFPQMVRNHTCRKTFIKSIDLHMRTFKFDGVDLDWEFPNKDPSGDEKQRMHFTQLLYEIRKEINRQEKHKFLLSIAVAAPRFIVQMAYDVSYMNRYVDYVNVMTYDFHFYTRLTPFTGLNAPLYDPTLSTLNINYSANYWNVNGMDKDKIIIGLPTYAHSFELLNVNNNGLFAPAKGYGELGHDGFVDFYEVCWFLLHNRIKLNFDYNARSPYASKDSEWISFDDETSLTFKAEYIKYYKFGGAMILSLNADDHRGYCKNDSDSAQFPLTKRVKAILNEM